MRICLVFRSFECCYLRFLWLVLLFFYFVRFVIFNLVAGLGFVGLEFIYCVVLTGFGTDFHLVFIGFEGFYAFILVLGLFIGFELDMFNLL